MLHHFRVFEVINREIWPNIGYRSAVNGACTHPSVDKFIIFTERINAPGGGLKDTN